MAEIKIRFDLTFSRRFLSVIGVTAMMLSAVPELDSESVTLSTYYPAPSGVYTQMITTGNTYLARDGGAATRVGIGTILPATKLHVVGVSGNTLAVDSPANPEITLRVNGVVRNYNAVATAAGAYFSGSAVGDWIFRTDSGAAIKFGRGGGTADLEVNTSGSVVVKDNIRAAGPIQNQQGPSCTTQSFQYPVPNGGSTGLCAGQYVTTISGFYTKYMAMPLDRGALLTPPVNNQFNFVCCACPTGGCTL